MSKAGRVQIAALKRSPTHLLYRVLQMAVDLYGQEAGARAVTQRQYTILAAVAESEGPSQNDLVRATGIDRSTLADLVARMIAAGLLARERSAEDGRAKVVTLTEQGHSVLTEIRPAVAAADERLLASLSSKKRETFVRLLQDLAKSTDAPVSGPLEDELEKIRPHTEAVASDGAFEAPSKPKKRKKDEKKKKKKKAKALAAAAEAAAAQAAADQALADQTGTAEEGSAPAHNA